MENLRIDKTLKTPEIDFDAQKGILKISGRAIPENPEELFSGVIQWVKEYFRSPQELTTIEIQLEYINSGSSKFILDFLHLLQDMHNSGKKCKVNWYYEEDDEAVQELGKHYQSILDLDFNLIETY
ncbi:MAG: DUF1987 domain-containing protein [Bacteroidota bacterium]